MPLPDVDEWLMAIWADSFGSNIPEPVVKTYDELTTPTRRIKQSDVQITRAELVATMSTITNWYPEGAVLKWCIGYCSNRQLLYVDTLESTANNWVWYRTAADGVDMADVPDTLSFDNDWREEDTLVNDYYGLTFAKQSSDNRHAYTLSGTVRLPHRIFIEALVSLKTWHLANKTGSCTVSFDVPVRKPSYDLFQQSARAYEGQPYAIRQAFADAIELANPQLAHFESNELVPTACHGLGFAYTLGLNWIDLIDKMAERANRAFIAWVQLHNDAESFFESDNMFATLNPLITYAGILTELPLLGYESVVEPNDDEDGLYRMDDDDDADDENRVGWQSGSGTKQGRVDMSADVITTMQLECEWLSDPDNEEKERKYRQARANLSPLDEGYFQTQHGNECLISYNALFRDIDPSRHEYRFADQNQPVVVLDCGHMFLKTSLQTWRTNAHTWACPLCRQELKKRVALHQLLFI